MKTWLTNDFIYAATALGILLLTFIVAYLFNRYMSRFIKKSTIDLDNDPTNYQFLKHAITALIYVVGLSLAIHAIPSLKTLAQSALAGAGIAALAIGFASQAALANITAGVFIVIFKPFRVKDRITIQNAISGVVEDITLRHTVIRNYENRRVVVPNSLISEELIINSDLFEQKICKWIEIGISYDSDIDKAREIMRSEIESHPLIIDNRTEEDLAEGQPKVVVRVISLGDFSVTLRAWAWAKDTADGAAMNFDLMESIKKRFDKEGIEIPFPYRTLVMKPSGPTSGLQGL